MKLRIMRSAWIALLFMSLSVTAQTTDKPEWSNELVSGVNKEEAVQIAIPFTDEQQAMNLTIEESPYYKTLNGIWKFHWVADPKDRPQDFCKPEYDVSQWDNIKVPATWQIEAVRHNKNWDKVPSGPLCCHGSESYRGMPDQRLDLRHHALQSSRRCSQPAPLSREIGRASCRERV